MVKVVLIAFGLIIAVFSSARAEAACGELPGALSCRVPTTGPQDTRDWHAAELLCCCKTYSEGECCSRAPKCGGKLPGCFCTSPSVLYFRARAATHHPSVFMPGILQRFIPARK